MFPVTQWALSTWLRFLCLDKGFSWVSALSFIFVLQQPNLRNFFTHKELHLILKMFPCLCFTKKSYSMTCLNLTIANHFADFCHWPFTHNFKWSISSSSSWSRIYEVMEIQQAEVIVLVGLAALFRNALKSWKGGCLLRRYLRKLALLLDSWTRINQYD